MCGAHATVRGLLGEIVAQTGNHRDIIVDMEAGLEHLSRGTGRHVSRFVAVLEPYYRSMETARRVAALAAELGIADVIALANKVRDESDRRAIAEFCASHGLRLAGEIPYDPTLVEAERIGMPPIDHDPAGPAVSAIRALAGSLVAEAA
jgi:CO dehydrogenase maturation factor